MNLHKPGPEPKETCTHEAKLKSPGLALSQLGRLESLLTDPELSAHLRAYLEQPWLLEDHEELWLSPEDIADVAGAPQLESVQERFHWAVDALGLAASLTNPDPTTSYGWLVSPRHHKRRERRERRRLRPEECFLTARLSGATPRWMAAAILADAHHQSFKLEVRPIEPDIARDFVRAHHSKLPTLNPRGLRHTLGAFRGERLVAVLSANTPSARGWASHPRKLPTRSDGPLTHKHVTEVTRIASDGTALGASSMLMRHLIARARPQADAPWLVITYSLKSERGTTYKALRELGLAPVALCTGRRPGGARRGSGVLATEDKIRWEVGGPGCALPARPGLLQDSQQLTLGL